MCVLTQSSIKIESISEQIIKKLGQNLYLIKKLQNFECRKFSNSVHDIFIQGLKGQILGWNTKYTI